MPRRARSKWKSFPTVSVAWLRCRDGDWFTVEHF
jgi:hypothetical protein